MRPAVDTEQAASCTVVIFRSSERTRSREIRQAVGGVREWRRTREMPIYCNGLSSPSESIIASRPARKPPSKSEVAIMTKPITVAAAALS